MRSWAFLSAAVLAMGVLGGVGAADNAARVAKAESIEKIMELTHTTNSGLRDKIVEEAGKDKPDWALIQKQAKQFTGEIAKLSKLTPPNGGKESWAKLTKAYADASKELETAAEKKDAKAVKVAYEKTGTACKACHDEHR